MSLTKKYIIVIAIFISSIALKSFGMDNHQQNQYATAIIINNTAGEMSLVNVGGWSSCLGIVVPPFETRSCQRVLPPRYFRDPITVNVPLRGGVFAGITLDIPVSTSGCGGATVGFHYGARERYNVDVDYTGHCTTIFKINTNISN